MNIVDFTTNHIDQAVRIAHQNYEEERIAVPALPPVERLPDLTGVAENGLGVAAFDGSEMVGFLCCFGPFQNAFGSTDAVGVFSPMHGNGAIGSHRAAVYARMYQAAGAKWAKAGASSHAICLYTHEREAQEQFFQYGFGLRCIDAMRPVEKLEPSPCHGYTFSELLGNRRLSIYPLDVLLNQHLAASPTFMRRSTQSKEEFAACCNDTEVRYFVAQRGGEIVAFLELLEGSGETFLTGIPGTQHIHGAFCMPEHRGRGVYQNLLAHVLGVLESEGYVHLGVDFESINPTAHRFWLKFFSAYTHSVVRRIDEHSIN